MIFKDETDHLYAQVVTFAKRLYTDSSAPFTRQDWWIGLIGIFLMKFVIAGGLKVLAFHSHASNVAIGICQLLAAGLLFFPFRNLTFNRLKAIGRPQHLFYLFFLPGVILSFGILTSLAGTIDNAARFTPNFLGQTLNIVTLIAVIWMFVELGILNRSENNQSAHS